jgi:SAM-dependent MidA family methyltransferase
MKESTVSFNQYVDNWLYGTNGYYSNYKEIGKEGDFYTAVSSSKFFGGSIGKRIVDIIKEGFLNKNTSIVEIGAHHGYLLADIIQFIFTLRPELIETLDFIIIEKHKILREKQKEYFFKCFGDTINIIHYNDLKDLKLDNAFIIANEIYDAFPCDLVYTNDNNQLHKAIVNNNKISFIVNDDLYLQDYCKKYKVTKGEVSRGYETFAIEMSTNINKFEFVTFDYGEKYPRNDFSCRVYEKHNVIPLFNKDINLEKLYQKSDITYDVNFQQVIDSFEILGIKTVNYQTQLKALVSFGIIELLEILHQNTDEKTYLREVNKVKTLLNPTGMGDKFKMVSFRK